MMNFSSTRVRSDIIISIMFFRKKSSKITSDHSFSAFMGAQAIPLNNVKVCSGVTNSILDSIFLHDISAYEVFFKGFVMGYYAENLFNKDNEAVDIIYGHAIGEDNNKKPRSLDTLVKAQRLDGEIGAVVQNAIIYAIAMYISWEHQYPGTQADVEYATELPNTRQPDKSPEQHVKDMTLNNPRAGVIAWSLCATKSKKLASVVVGRMDYLLATCEYDKEESEEELTMRILNEQLD